METTRKIDVRKLAVTAVMGAVAAVLMFISFSVPLMPSFIKLDLSELPALIASFALGPVSGVAVCFIKNLVNLPFTTTSCVGELCNFLLGAAFVLPAGLLYKKLNGRKGALIGSLVGAAAMAGFKPAYQLFHHLPLLCCVHAHGGHPQPVPAYKPGSGKPVPGAVVV